MRIVDVKFKDIKNEFDKMTNSSNSGGDNGSSGGGYKTPKQNIFKKLLIILVLIFVISGIGTSFYSVDQTEYVVLTTFGVPSMNIQEPGLKFKLPFGLQKIRRISKRTFSTTLGYIQKNNDTSGENIIVNEQESKMITGDENIILADLEVQWRIVDPIAYLYNNDQPSTILYNAISSSLRNVIGSSTVDEALTDGRSQIIEKVRERLTKIVNEYKLGVSIVNVNLQDIDLPTNEVDAAFKSVTDAREERITKINEANKYKNEKMNELVGKKSAILSKANADKTVAIQSAKGDVAEFNALYSEYEKQPNITKKDMLIRTLTNVYKNAKIVITDGDTFKYMSIDDLLKGGAIK